MQRKFDHATIPELARVNYPEGMDLSPPSFANLYQDSLPELARVSTGYCGNNGLDFTFSLHEVNEPFHVDSSLTLSLQCQVKPSTAMLN